MTQGIRSQGRLAHNSKRSAKLVRICLTNHVQRSYRVMPATVSHPGCDTAIAVYEALYSHSKLELHDSYIKAYHGPRNP